MSKNKKKAAQEVPVQEQAELKVEDMGEYFKIIADGDLETESLRNHEKEIALKILADLNGTLVIRANSILNFCIKAIQYSTVRIHR